MWHFREHLTIKKLRLTFSAKNNRNLCLKTTERAIAIASRA